MILAMRLFLVFMFVLAYAEGRYITREVTIALFLLAWLGVYAVNLREKARRRR